MFLYQIKATKFNRKQEKTELKMKISVIYLTLGPKVKPEPKLIKTGH